MSSETALCSLRVEATGSGKQFLQINEDSVLSAAVATIIQSGGEVDLQGGELTGGTVSNAGNSLRGYGTVSADIVNQGLIEAVLNAPLICSGADFRNEASGLLSAPIASVLAVQSPSVTQTGQIDVRANGTAAFTAPLTNAADGVITLLGGVLGAAGVTNESPAAPARIATRTGYLMTVRPALDGSVPTAGRLPG